MARPRPMDYAGATGRLELARVPQLGARYAVQPKVDGCLARVHLDDAGRIDRLFSRSGREFPRELVADLVGQQIGSPGAELVGEIEVWTERANRLAATRGYRMLHLFDAIRVDGIYLGRAPYHERRSMLWRCQSAAVGPERSWAPAHGGRSRNRRSGQLVRSCEEGWRVAPIVEQRSAREADGAWADWVEHGEAEGLVVVDLQAPLGKGKRKVKAADTLDCTVIEHDGRVARLAWAGGTFVVSAIGAELELGQVVEVCHEGYFEAGAKLSGRSFGAGATPRFPRIVRRRPDLRC